MYNKKYHTIPEGCKEGDVIEGHKYPLTDLNPSKNLSILLDKMRNTKQTFLFSFRGTPSHKFITKFLEQMAVQDNRSTAAPYFYTIRDEEEYQCDPDNATSTKVYWDAEDYAYMEELQSSLIESGYDEAEATVEMQGATEYGVGTRWVQNKMFLTETDAEDHLRSNKHHYTDKAHTYVNHAWRAPKLTRFMKALFTHFEIDEGNYGLRI